MKLAIVALVAVAVARVASAHPMPSSDVALHVRADRIDATLTLPISELTLGWQRPSDDDALKTYVRAHMHGDAPDGRAWIVDVGDVATASNDVIVHATLTPPAGAPVDRLTLHYDVILHRLITHTAIVRIDDKPVAMLSDITTAVAIDRSHERDHRRTAIAIALALLVLGAIAWRQLRTSSPMSTAGAECVNAPTEIRSAPARA